MNMNRRMTVSVFIKEIAKNLNRPNINKMAMQTVIQKKTTYTIQYDTIKFNVECKADSKVSLVWHT